MMPPAGSEQSASRSGPPSGTKGEEARGGGTLQAGGRARDALTGRRLPSWLLWTLVGVGVLVVQSDVATGDYIHAALWIALTLNFAQRANAPRRQTASVPPFGSSSVETEEGLAILSDWSWTLRIWWAWIWRSVAYVVAVMALTVTAHRAFLLATGRPLTRLYPLPRDAKFYALLYSQVFVSEFLAFRNVLRKTFNEFEIRILVSPLRPITWRDAFSAYVNIAIPVVLVYMAILSIVPLQLPWILVLWGVQLSVLHFVLTRKIPVTPPLIVISREPLLTPRSDGTG